MVSCKKDDETETDTPFQASSGGMYISNEGNFQSSNSSVSFFNPHNSALTEDAYKQVNQTSPGDVCQSMSIMNGSLYVVVNNSGKIEVCDLYLLNKKNTIGGLTSPRYIAQINNSKAYVSDAYSNKISIINLTNNTLSGTIDLNGWTEQMLLLDGKVYVTNMQSEYLYVIDTTSNQVNDSILITRGANSICKDSAGKIWVLCGGDYLLSINGALHRIDPATHQVEVSAGFSAGEYPTRLSINGSGNSLYYLNTSIWKMDVSASSLPSTPFIASQGNNFYGLGIDKVKNEVYVSDAIDFVQKGKVYRYKADGTAIENFTAGIIPGDFLFLP
jgi:YVTN family beta-propeller protein